MLASRVRADLAEAERLALLSKHPLRVRLASSAEIDGRYVRKHLCHAMAEMTRHYQRRLDRHRVNLTKTDGL